ncbi:MAG TPA: hypothetical protein VFZ23_02545 [Pyrinomonadaceae bacterium]
MANRQSKQSSESSPTQKNMTNEPGFDDKTSQREGSGATSTQTGGGIAGGTPTRATGTGAGTPSTGTGSGSTPIGTGGIAGSTGTATATARSFIDQAKETAGQAYEAVTDKAATKLDERKSTLTTPLSTVADSVRQMSANLGSAKTDSGLAEAAAKYTETAARKIENLAGYFDTRSVRDMAHDLEGFARRNPAVFLGAAFGLGILVARFLKSTPPHFSEGSRELNRTGSIDTEHQLTTGTSRSTGNAPNTAVNPL